MNLSQRQSDFLYAVARLIVWAKESLCLSVKVSEWYRTVELEKQYIAQGKSKLTNPEDCKHCVGLAVDLAIIDPATGYVTDGERYRQIGEKWEQLGGKWGGRFGVASSEYQSKVGWDVFHFEFSKS